MGKTVSEVVLFDSTLAGDYREARVSCWEDLAEKVSAFEGKVVILMGVRAKRTGAELKLNADADSCRIFQADPQSAKAGSLKRKFEPTGDATSAVTAGNADKCVTSLFVPGQGLMDLTGLAGSLVVFRHLCVVVLSV
jgi:hypothetical protein